MEIGNRIKFYRNKLKISQEELAEKVFVSRQSISNWENGKTYPDINSLILLSNIFELSLDDLVKGDIDKMKEEVQKLKPTEKEIEEYKKVSLIYSSILVFIILIPYPLFYFFNKYSKFIFGFIIYLLIGIIGIFYAVKVERLMKKYDIRTYKEILAFTEGIELDEIEKWKEIGKRSYQKIFLVFFVSVTTLFVFLVFYYIFKIF